MEIHNLLDAKSRAELREWLIQNHKTEKECWIPWRAIINASGTGYMWLNGHNIGRYWEEGPQREFFLPECWLNMGGTNTLVLGLRQSETCGAVLEGIEVAPYYEDAEFIK